ncbi:hypothetical protein PQI07_06590 [Methylobacterium sp. 092160098-2]|uniref:hypothetical protein n=1 Tax=Methylobacterium sp. 092160098-2 TaxID=3025129 RepID=UPI002381B087|nr:hypothetical protein [Methylobacterium sp. 092160098-2]MDE4910369.1 hypothetical protein [Methylobacterium sp. 092160098-2]
MSRFLLAALAGLSLAAGIQRAEAAPAPCNPFTAFPLAFNLGSGLNTGDGETVRCSLGKIGLAMAASQASIAAVQSSAQQALTTRLANTANDLSAGSFAGLGSHIPFGNTDAKHYVYSHRDDNQPSLLGTAASVRNTPGSGTFGPGAADFAHFFSATKDGWSTSIGSSAGEGEIDTIYVINRQGKKGDAAGVLVDVAKRRDLLSQQGADENGGLLGYELGAALYNAGGQPYHEVHNYGAFIEGPGGISQGAGYGNLSTSFRGRQFAAFGASVLPGAAPNAGFQRFGFLDTTGAADGSGIIWQVDSLGRGYSGLPNSRVTYGYQPGIDTFTFTDENNAVLAAVGRTSKVLTGVGGLQVGSGSITSFTNAVTASATVPNLTSLGVTDLTALSITGAQPGDMVTVSTVAADSGLSGYRLSGVVTAANAVTIRVQNLNSVTAGGANIQFTAKVERFR